MLLRDLKPPSDEPVRDSFGYYAGCLRRLAANARARERRRARLLTGQPLGDYVGSNPEDRLATRLTIEQILDRVPAADAELLRWRFLEDRLMREIAELLEITEDAVWKRINRALANARTLLNIQQVG